MQDATAVHNAPSLADFPAPPALRRGALARLIHACHGPNGLRALGVLSFLESSLLPVPIDLAMIPVGLARRNQMHIVILVATAGSILGAVLGYLIGALFMASLGQWLVSIYGGSDVVGAFQRLYDAHGWQVVAIAGITPLPFKVAAILSGASKMSFPVFVATTAGIRLLRFALMGLLVKIFGRGLESLMHHHARKVAYATFLLVIVGFVILPFVL